MTSSTPVPPKQRTGHLIFVLGAPGSGKGTNCRLLANDSHFNRPQNLTVRHTSVGDLLRKQLAAGVLPPSLATKVNKQILMDGADITTVIANSGVLDQQDGGDREVVILDGFPRNMDQLRAFSKRVSKLKKHTQEKWAIILEPGFFECVCAYYMLHGQFGEPDLVLSLLCPRKVAMERYLARRDATRPDGDETLFMKRCDEFELENPGILQYYETSIPGRLVQIDVSSSQGIDRSYNNMKESLLQNEYGPWYEVCGQNVYT